MTPQVASRLQAARELCARQRRRPRPLDARALDACLAWILRARQAGRGGIPAMYRMVRGEWDVDYPETTGYTIPTLLEHGSTGTAAQLGRWEIGLQEPSGGVGEPPGAPPQAARVFNTSQVVLGWLALGEEPFLAAALRAGRFLVEAQDPDGKWTRSTCAGPKSYHARTAWALFELHRAMGEPRFLDSARRATAWVLQQATPRGWFAHTSLDDPARPWTHLLAYTLVGLQKIARLHAEHVDAAAIESVLERAAGELSAICDGGLPGTLDADWQGPAGWSCLTGDAQLAFFLRSAGRTEAADRLLAGLVSLQLADTDDPNLEGGLAGSFPLDGPYCAFAVPKWAVKFLADALLQRTLPEERWRFLG